MINNPFLIENRQYIFRSMQREIENYLQESPCKLYNLGVGDVVQPVAPVVRDAMRKAVDEMANMQTFHGYPPTEGYDFALHAIESYYKDMGIDLSDTHISVGSGAKDELSAWNDIFDADMTALIPSPAYPLYADISRKRGRMVKYMDIYEKPEGEGGHYLIYLCSPNNPTGTCYTIDELQQWVDFAIKTESVILFDAAYCAFAYPYSIFACKGAEYVCIEIGTLSKSASFSGLRFGWSIVGKGAASGKAWRAYTKYKSTSTNGVAYPVQRAGEAALSKEGLEYGFALIKGYRNNALMIGDALRSLGVPCQIGPYVWLDLSEYRIEDPFKFFLKKAHLIVTDGRGFGPNGENHVRMSVFAIGGQEQEIVERLQRALK